MLEHAWFSLIVLRKINLSTKPQWPVASNTLGQLLINQTKQMYEMFTNKRGIPPGYIRKIWLIMRLTTVILIATFMQVSAAGFAQKITMSKKNVPLEQVIQDLRKLSGFDFIATESLLSRAEPVTIEVKNVEFEKVLDRIFEDQRIDYVIEGRTVTLKRKEKSYFETVIDRFQAIDIKGRVVDSLGNGLAGANITIKNGKGSTSTTATGEFFMKNVDENAVLVVSYLGYVTREFKVSTEYNYIQLQQSESKLDEVQIMAYGKTSRRLSTGNIATIKADEIAKQNVTNPLLALKGRIPGVTITPSSGVPGAPVKIEVRGQNSLGMGIISGQLEPLYVINGVPFVNNMATLGGASRTGIGANGDKMSAFSFINPSDIESIDILKDADATAIYGSRGANGVILITTKKGQEGKTSININASSGYTEVPSKLKLLNTQQYLEMRKEAFKNDNATPSKNQYDFGLYSPDLLFWDQNSYTDWQDVLIGGIGKQNNVQTTVTGGSPFVQYMVGGNYRKQTYVFPGDARDENGTLHFNISGNTQDQKLSLSLSGIYNANTNKSPFDLTRISRMLAPNSPQLYLPNGELNWGPHPETGFATWQNPLASLMSATQAKSKTINSNVTLIYRLNTFLTFNTNAGFSSVNGESFTPSPIASMDPAMIASNRGRATHLESNQSSVSIEPFLSCSFRFLSGKIDLVLGGAYQSQILSDRSIYASGYTSDALLQSLTSASNFFGGNHSSEYKYIAGKFRATYNYQNKYMVNLNLLRDGSSRFGPDHQFGNFGSIGLAYIFSEEEVVERLTPWLSFGKLRFNYGTSGNDGIGDYRYKEFYNPVWPFSGGTYRGTRPLETEGVTNPDYRWEVVRKMEFSLELGFFKDRILVNSTYYRNRSTNQLGRLELPYTAGPNNFYMNQDAKIQNMGYEFLLQTKNIQSKKITWNSSFNISMARNKILFIPEGNAFGNRNNQIGQPFSGVIHNSPIYLGVDKTTGLYTVELPKTQNDPIYTIVTMPKYSGGFGNEINYRGVSFGVFLGFRKGMIGSPLFKNAIASSPGAVNFYGSGGQEGGNQPIGVFNRWQKPGDIAEIQRFSTRNDTQNSEKVNEAIDQILRSDRAYIDAFVLDLNNITVGYQFNQRVVKKMGINNLALNLQGSNIWTFYKQKGIDADIQNTDVLPQLRSVTFGLQIGF